MLKRFQSKVQNGSNWEDNPKDRELEERIKMVA